MSATLAGDVSFCIDVVLSYSRASFFETTLDGNRFGTRLVQRWGEKNGGSIDEIRTSSKEAAIVCQV